MFKHLTTENDFVKCWFDNYVGVGGVDLVPTVEYIYIFLNL